MVREHVDSGRLPIYKAVKHRGRDGVHAGEEGIDWRGWSDESFEEARRDGKLVLLDLTATWCHWCHVMDRTTYSDPEVVRMVNEGFVPVRVDIDLRPDISERYNRGGFPTTAFLSDQGLSVWGATYVPPDDFKRVAQAVLNAKRSGEIDRALEDAKPMTRQAQRSRSSGQLPSEEGLEDVLADIMDSYDVEHGGFGLEPKFPHPEAVDLLIYRSSSETDPVLGRAAAHTLTRMAYGLYDDVEGGVFRYSVSRDWSVPHFEKMLETNLGYLRNLVRGHAAFGDPKLRGLAEGVAGYLLGTLRDPATGAFYGSQDADEEYYGLRGEARRSARPPETDRTVYSGWNALAAKTFIEAGALLGRKDLIDAGLAALDHVMERLWNPDRGLVRHSAEQELYLSEDQAELLGAFVAAMELRSVDRDGPAAFRLVDSVRAAFSHGDGGLGDIETGTGGLGALSSPVRSLVTNSRWAHGLALLGAATDRADLTEEAGNVLASFDLRTVKAHGVFSAAYVSACDALRAGPVKVEVRGPGRPYEDALWLASKRLAHPGIVTLFARDDEAFAVACSHSRCSTKIGDPAMLSDELRRLTRPAQV